jgi:NAD(P)H-dependent flavin oxidoreductase YrpB (nitropropane dioxygenase family)
MLYTYLTTSWHLRYPIIAAPMAGVAGGRLARAVSQAGGLGMIGVGSQGRRLSYERQTLRVEAIRCVSGSGSWPGPLKGDLNCCRRL